MHYALLIVAGKYVIKSIMYAGFLRLDNGNFVGIHQNLVWLCLQRDFQVYLVQSPDHKKYDFNESVNFQAGYILDMYAKDKLRWNDYSPLSSEIKNMWIKTLPIEKDGQSPVRTVRDLKEKLYKQIMKLLKRGNIQEGALETAKELEGNHCSNT